MPLNPRVVIAGIRSYCSVKRERQQVTRVQVRQVILGRGRGWRERAKGLKFSAVMATPEGLEPPTLSSED